MEERNTALLDYPVDQLPLTEDCRMFLKALRISRLRELIAFGWAELRSHKEFNYIEFNEVVSYLRENDLLYLMDGKT